MKGTAQEGITFWETIDLVTVFDATLTIGKRVRNYSVV